MRTFLSVFIFALALLSVGGVESGFAQTIYENNFDQYSTERIYTDDDLDNDWNTPNFNDGVTEGRVSIVGPSQAYGGTGSAMAVFYPAGQDGTKDTGAQWQLEFDGEYEEVFLRYRVKFENGFDFVRGGKLPGLAGGTSPTGSTQATGTNGWTGRMMWRTDFDGVSGNPQQLTSNAISYAKYTDSGFDEDGRDEDKEYWLESDGARTVIESGQWYEIVQRVKMNQPGQRDGILQIWLDGNLVHDQTDVLFRTSNAFSIDQMYFSTFFGGNADWRTSKDETVYFDDFQITAPEPPSEPRFIKVPEHFPTVQEAIDFAVAGDTVAVRGQIFENIVVDKAILVRGYEDTRITSASLNLPVIRVVADGAHIRKFETRRGSNGVLVEENLNNVIVEQVDSISSRSAGIRLKQNCDGAQLIKNTVYYSGSHGILVDRSDNVEVVDCKSFGAAATGVSIFNSSNCLVEGCVAWENERGFSIVGNENTVDDNFAFRNNSTAFGVTGNENVIHDNYSRLNGRGFSFSHSSDNQVTENVSREDSRNAFQFRNLSNGNTVIDNVAKLPGGLGLYIDMSTDNVIDDLIAIDGRGGILATLSTASNAVSNSLVQDNSAFGIIDYGSGNTFDGVITRRNGNN